MRGLSSSGHANPFGSAMGLITMTSIVCGGVKPTSRDTSSRVDSSRSAARIAQASYSTG